MKYYRVKKEYDNVAMRRISFGNRVVVNNCYIGGELFTVKEMEKHQKNHLLPVALEKFTELVEIPQNKVFWSFGARFEIKGE